MDLSHLSDRDLVLEIYRRIKGEDEMSVYRTLLSRRLAACVHGFR